MKNMANSLINGKPMINIMVPTIGYVASHEAITEHNARVDKDYKGLDVLKPFNYHSKACVVSGSNIPGTALLFQKTLSQAGYRLAGLQDLEDARAINQRNSNLGLHTQGVYVDLGIVIRANTDRTEHIVNQIRKRNPKLATLKQPVAILLSGIEPVIGGPLDGLSYNLLENAVIYSAPEFTRGNNSFSRVVNGRLKLDSKGNRAIYNSSLDISRLYLYRDLNVGSSDEYLAYSYSDGQVVCVSGEATDAKILREYQKNNVPPRLKPQKP